MVEIPKQLQKLDFGFVLLGKWNSWGRYENINGKSKLVETREINPVDYEEYHKNKDWKPLGKAPFQAGWQKKHLTFDCDDVKKHYDNIGINGGFGRLRILDIDNSRLGEALEKSMNTLTHRTGSGGRHFLFTSDWDKNEVLVNGLGEIRASNYQVVIPPSKHPSGNPYCVHINKPIREITKEELLEIIKPYLRNSQPKEQSSLDIGQNSDRSDSINYEENQEQRDTSRSAQEMKEVIKMLAKGYSFSAIDKRMMCFAKWSSSPEAYRKKTLEKAREHLSKIYADNLTEKENEKIDLEPFYDKDLIGYKTENQAWLIENQLPVGEIGFLVGKRGHSKSFIAMVQAIALASKQTQVFNDSVGENDFRILWIDEEMGKNEIAKRMNAIKKGLGIEDKELNICFISQTGLKLDTIDSPRFKEFEKIYSDFKPNLVVVDCLQRVVSFEVDKENALISNFLTSTIRQIQKSVDGEKATWYFIHHLRKSSNGNNHAEDELDEVRGGSELVNLARFVLKAEEPKYQTQSDEGVRLVVLKVLKFSNFEKPEAKVISFTRVDENTTKVEYVGIPKEVLKGELQSAKAIHEWLFNNSIVGEFKTATILEASDEIKFSKTLISQGLKTLVSQGVIQKLKRGIYKLCAEEGNQKTLVTKPKEQKKIDDDEDIEKMLGGDLE